MLKSIYPIIYQAFQNIVMYGLLTFAIDIAIAFFAGSRWKVWNRKRISISITVIIIFAVFFIICIKVGVNLIRMPNFVNQNFDVAVKMIEESQLENTVFVESIDSNVKYEDHIILAQNIEAGTIINRSEEVILETTYNRLKMISIPDFIGRSVEEAQLFAEEIKIILYISGNASAADIITTQTPNFTQDAYIPSGSTVRVTVGNKNASQANEYPYSASTSLRASESTPPQVSEDTSPQTSESDPTWVSESTPSRVDNNSQSDIDLVTVPNLIGMYLIDAQDLLAELNLRSSYSTNEWRHPPLIVTNQTILPGSNIQINSIVELEAISQRHFFNEPSIVPNVLGLSKYDAIDAIFYEGLTVRVYTDSEAGRVVNQSPDAGTHLEFGTQIEITIGT